MLGTWYLIPRQQERTKWFHPPAGPANGEGRSGCIPLLVALSGDPSPYTLEAREQFPYPGRGRAHAEPTLPPSPPLSGRRPLPLSAPTPTLIENANDNASANASANAIANSISPTLTPTQWR